MKNEKEKKRKPLFPISYLCFIGYRLQTDRYRSIWICVDKQAGFKQKVGQARQAGKLTGRDSCLVDRETDSRHISKHTKWALFR